MDGKVALIVGGGSGIGRGTAARLVAAGARVVIADVSRDGAEAVAAELGDQARAVAGDVTDTADVARFVETAVEEFGSLDISINSAGVGTLGMIHDHPESEWDRVVGICLKGTFLTTKHASHRMIEQGTGGVILNISSINGRQPAEGFVAYCSAKAGVEMLIRVASMELGRHGIRVVGIAPGFVDTPLTAGGGEAAKAIYLDKTPLGRTGEVDDIAAAAEFLVSDQASWVSGETLVVDGAATTASTPASRRCSGSRDPARPWRGDRRRRGVRGGPPLALGRDVRGPARPAGRRVLHHRPRRRPHRSRGPRRRAPRRELVARRALGLVVAQAPRPDRGAVLDGGVPGADPVRSHVPAATGALLHRAGRAGERGALRRQRPLLPAQWDARGHCGGSQRARQRRLVRGARRTAGRDAALHLVDARGRLRLVHVERSLPAAPVAGRGRARRAGRRRRPTALAGGGRRTDPPVRRRCPRGDPRGHVAVADLDAPRREPRDGAPVRGRRSASSAPPSDTPSASSTRSSST